MTCFHLVNLSFVVACGSSVGFSLWKKYGWGVGILGWIVGLAAGYGLVEGVYRFFFWWHPPAPPCSKCQSTDYDSPYMHAGPDLFTCRQCGTRYIRQRLRVYHFQEVMPDGSYRPYMQSAWRKGCWIEDTNGEGTSAGRS